MVEPRLRVMRACARGDIGASGGGGGGDIGVIGVSAVAPQVRQKSAASAVEQIYISETLLAEDEAGAGEGPEGQEGRRMRPENSLDYTILLYFKELLAPRPSLFRAPEGFYVPYKSQYGSSGSEQSPGCGGETFFGQELSRS